MNKPKYIIVHHECPPQIVNGDRFDIVDNYHKSLGWGGIGYHYFIEKSGIVKRGRADNEEGCHTVGKNTESLGICLAGNFDLEMPSGGQIKALGSLITQKKQEYGILPENIVPHRKFANYKSCYGKLLGDNWARNLIQNNTKENIIQQIKDLLDQL